MGNFCACTSAKRTERTLNHSPDEQIQAVSGIKKGKQQKQQQQQLVRFFLTGLGSAGKTTIVRQLHLLCNQNPNYKLCDEEWNEIGRKAGENAMAENRLWARQIRRNVLDMFDLFIRHIEEAGGQLAESRNQEIANKINQFCEEANWEEMESELVELRAGLVDLLRDEAIRQAHKHRNKVEVEGKKLFDGCDHFMREEEIMKIFSADYQASDEDKVHSRNPTADMHTYRFKLNETRIEITDVGGQPSELIKIVDYLRNWSFHCGDGGEEATHNFILLVVSMSDFNVRHQRYEGTLLDECVSYMKVLLNNQIAQNCGLLIFFNKKDRFREKLLDADCRQDIGYLAPFLPPKLTRDFLAKGKFDERQMGDALASKFVEAIKEMKERQKDTYCRFTCAIDTKMMEGIFGAIKDDILNQSLLNAFP